MRLGVLPAPHHDTSVPPRVSGRGRVDDERVAVRASPRPQPIDGQDDARGGGASQGDGHVDGDHPLGGLLYANDQRVCAGKSAQLKRLGSRATG